MTKAIPIFVLVLLLLSIVSVSAWEPQPLKDDDVTFANGFASNG
ncbi:MAG: hypothetical protein O0X93_00755 [Methanocorpusculum sp.]|nr:hypothetical protein [Methanocorpusculum sp.]MDE2523916.1 hypothetical protein [Methanocorpusculum sp.]